MAHSDDEGLVLPPMLAPYQTVIIPFFLKNKEEVNANLMTEANALATKLRAKGIKVKVDTDDQKRPGFKFAEYEMKGVPTRIVIGPRDLENGTVEVARRDTKEKFTAQLDGVDETIDNLLKEIQENIYKKALDFRTENTYNASTFEEFKDIIENKQGFVVANWDGNEETEEKIKTETKATIRCIPLEGSEPDGPCIYSGNKAKHKVIFAKAY